VIPPCRFLSRALAAFDHEGGTKRQARLRVPHRRFAGGSAFIRLIRSGGPRLAASFRVARDNDRKLPEGAAGPLFEMPVFLPLARSLDLLGGRTRARVIAKLPACYSHIRVRAFAEAA